MENEKLIPLSEVKKKLTAVRQYFSGYPSTEQDKLARSVVKLCMEEVGKIKPVDALLLPVKIGQVLWCNIPHSEVPLECRVYCICREDRNGLVLDYFRCAVKGWFGKAFSYEDVGKTVFLTREEAEAALAERRTDNAIQ